MMPFIYLQARLTSASDSISSLDCCCTLTLSWTDHQEKQLKSPSVFLPFCPLSLPAVRLHFTFESGFDHVDLSIKSYAETNDSLHSSPGMAVRQLKKVDFSFFIFFFLFKLLLFACKFECLWIKRWTWDRVQFFGAHSSCLSLFMMYFHHALWIAGKETLPKYQLPSSEETCEVSSERKWWFSNCWQRVQIFDGNKCIFS